MKGNQLLASMLLTGALTAQLALGPDGNTVTASKLIIHADREKDTISRNIYGHFSEHLGRGVYKGIWVGEDSSIPNTRGIRNDVVAALKKIKVPVLRWPGDALPTSIIGKTASGRNCV